MRNSFVQQIEPAKDALSMEEFVGLFSTAFGQTRALKVVDKLVLVKELLGRRRRENTMKYTRLVKFKDSDFDVETATTVDQAKEFLKVGFDYIAEKDGIMLFRRPKRFGSLGVTGES